MGKHNVALMIVLSLVSIATAGQISSAPQTGPAFPAPPVTIGDFNLPSQPIGVSDLILLTVSDSPELSRSFRVDVQGNLNLPLLKPPIAARGFMPNVLGDEIAAALRAQHLLVNPVVVVSVVEYAGRGVTVAGAVKTLPQFRTWATSGY
jgi:protein involved in polysaccharide export with SLBB domain